MGKPLRLYFPQFDEEDQEERQQRGLWITTRCEICDIAFDMGMSEDQFLRKFPPGEREQILATYRSRQKRLMVMMQFPEPS